MPSSEVVPLVRGWAGQLSARLKPVVNLAVYSPVSFYSFLDGNPITNDYTVILACPMNPVLSSSSTPPTQFPRRKPVPSRPTSSSDTIPTMAALNPEPADPVEREEHHLPPKTYKDAAEEALQPTSNGRAGGDGSIYDTGADEALNRDPAPKNDDVDEQSIKETPPRLGGHDSISSEPRPLWGVMDEAERIEMPHSPSLRHPRGRLEETDGRNTYVDAVRSSPSPAAPLPINGHVFGGHSAAIKATETFDGVGEDATPRSPVRKPHQKTSSRSLNGTRPLTPNRDQIKEETPDQLKGEDQENPKKQTSTASGLNDSTNSKQQPKSGLVYENVFNKSGDNLATIKPSEDISVNTQQRVDTPLNAPSDALTARKRPTISKRNDSQLVSGRRAGSGWARSAIRWAPLSVPLQRRTQMLMVLLHTLSIVGFLAIFFLLCTVPLLWPVLMPYLVYCLFSRASVSGELTHRSEWLRRSKIWSAFASYFPARLHRTQVLEPTRKYIFGYHPHGIISHGAFAAFGTEALGFSQLFPGITNTLLTLDSNFRIPLYRDHALRMGLASVSRESCENILSKGGPNGEGMGRAITIVIGGARESLDARPYTLRLVLKRRKGFVKLAIRTGADLVPVLAFGENDIYDQFDGAGHPYVHKAQLLVKKFMGFTVPLFHARGMSFPVFRLQKTVASG